MVDVLLLQFIVNFSIWEYGIIRLLNLNIKCKNVSRYHTGIPIMLLWLLLIYCYWLTLTILLLASLWTSPIKWDISHVKNGCYQTGLYIYKVINIYCAKISVFCESGSVELWEFISFQLQRSLSTANQGSVELREFISFHLQRFLSTVNQVVLNCGSLYLSSSKDFCLL